MQVNFTSQFLSVKSLVFSIKFYTQHGLLQQQVKCNMEHTFEHPTQCLSFYLCCIKVETQHFWNLSKEASLHVTHMMCYFNIPTTNTSIIQYYVEHVLMKWKQERALYKFLECLSINTTHGAVICPPQREWAK